MVLPGNGLRATFHCAGRFEKADHEHTSRDDDLHRDHQAGRAGGAGADDTADAAAQGWRDPDQGRGHRRQPPDASDLPGLEAAGTVAALGAGVTGWKAGDEICALTPGGGYAEYCIVPAPQCLPVPKGFDMLRAAALPENYFTVWHNVFERGGLKAGESVLIHGGASGIGTTAIQLAKAFGATVFTTVRNEGKAKAVRALGADHAIIYKDNDWAAEVKALSGGIDVVLDMVAGDYLPKNLQLLKQDGRCVVIAGRLDAMAMISAGVLTSNCLTLIGSTLRPQSVANKGRMARGLKEKVWPLLEAGKVKPIIYKTFPLREASAAHAELERADHVGKVMLTV